MIQGDADTDLVHYPDLAFDYAILSQTIQATYAPRDVLEQLLRIGSARRVSFPNFGHWRVRATASVRRANAEDRQSARPLVRHAEYSSLHHQGFPRVVRRCGDGRAGGRAQCLWAQARPVDALFRAECSASRRCSCCRAKVCPLRSRRATALFQNGANVALIGDLMSCGGFGLGPKTERVNMRLPKPLLEAVKTYMCVGFLWARRRRGRGRCGGAPSLRAPARPHRPACSTRITPEKVGHSTSPSRSQNCGQLSRMRQLKGGMYSAYCHASGENIASLRSVLICRRVNGLP